VSNRDTMQRIFDSGGRIERIYNLTHMLLSETVSDQLCDLVVDDEEAERQLLTAFGLKEDHFARNPLENMDAYEASEALTALAAGWMARNAANEDVPDLWLIYASAPELTPHQYGITVNEGWRSPKCFISYSYLDGLDAAISWIEARRTTAWTEQRDLAARAHEANQ